ncbi:DUF3606 domain-containing protein [Vibrio cortegadensis]|uniref:DUF3606 domain-containing protein n=1 Tax=Vibrio cortegadensis TaxID=1328770 RepID=UPI0021C41252|nr:DUF3606 domain-containing protein [Vibrio cortegadensis]MDN3696365.1 DUF3606 domain-containing protein [Vibrio cortegadensis]
MPDNLDITRPLDAQRVSLSQEHEVVYWTNTLKITRAQLVQAVSEAGTYISDIKKWLANRR